MKIVIAGGKGGTGKSTFAVNLAVMRAASGRDVLLINTDPTGIAAAWAERRQEAGLQPSITCISLFGKGVTAEIRRLAPRFDDLIVDCAGTDSPEQRQAMLAAEVMVIPSRASQFDLDALVQVNTVVGDALGFNPTAQALVVVNAGSTHAASTDGEDMAEAIGDMANLTLAKSVVRHRVSFQRAAAEGAAVTESLPLDLKAIAEMADLYREVFGSTYEAIQHEAQ